MARKWGTVASEGLPPKLSPSSPNKIWAEFQVQSVQFYGPLSGTVWRDAIGVTPLRSSTDIDVVRHFMVPIDYVPHEATPNGLEPSLPP